MVCAVLVLKREILYTFYPSKITLEIPHTVSSNNNKTYFAKAINVRLKYKMPTYLRKEI